MLIFCSSGQGPELQKRKPTKDIGIRSTANPEKRLPNLSVSGSQAHTRSMPKAFICANQMVVKSRLPKLPLPAALPTAIRCLPLELIRKGQDGCAILFGFDQIMQMIGHEAVGVDCAGQSILFFNKSIHNHSAYHGIGERRKFAESADCDKGHPVDLSIKIGLKSFISRRL